MRPSQVTIIGSYAGTIIGCYITAWSSVYLWTSGGSFTYYFDDLLWIHGGERAYFTTLYSMVLFVPLALVSLFFMHRGFKKMKERA